MAEVGATGALNTRYIRGTGLIAREMDGAMQYYLFDAHGDVLHRLDASGNVLKTYRYDAFGNEIDPEPLDTNPFRYCGEYFDREIGTYYLRARNYDPRIGRFTTEDALRSATVSLPGDRKAVDPLSLNLYTYCHNNPVRYTDPMGNAAYNGVSYPVSKETNAASLENLDFEKIIEQQAVAKWSSPWFKMDNAKAFDMNASFLDWSEGVPRLIKASALVAEVTIDQNHEGGYMSIGAWDAKADVGLSSLSGEATIMYYTFGVKYSGLNFGLKVNLGGIGGGYTFNSKEASFGVTFGVGARLFVKEDE